MQLSSIGLYDCNTIIEIKIIFATSVV